MSWSIEEHIGECRPFPAQVVVYRGETDECLAYVNGEVADRLKAENAKLREQGARLFDKTLELGTENDKLRELVRDMWNEGMCECGSLGKCERCVYDYLSRMRELGIEVK